MINTEILSEDGYNAVDNLSIDLHTLWGYNSNYMKLKFIIPIMAVSLLLASIFGFAGMNHINMNCDPGSSTSTCPPSQIGMAFHHISSYGNFLTAIISPTTASVISVLLLLVAAFVFARYVLLNQVLSLSRLYSREDTESSLSQYRKLTRWLALFENSPAV